MNAYSIILLAAALLFLAVGIAIYRGNAKLIHDYHQENIKESDKPEYCRAFAKGMFVLAATLFISGIIPLVGKEGSFLIASPIILVSGLIVSIIIIVKVQKKYNGGLF